MHNAAFADHMERWGQLAGGVAEHAGDAAFLQPDRASLIRAQAEAWEAKQRQLRHRAAAQQATRDLEAAMARAHEAASRLQHGLLAKYGATNPKLVAFGMHPRRVGKASARVKALAALPALKGGASPHPAAEPPSTGGNVPQAEADAAWTRGDVPQAEADAAASFRAASTGGGEAPRAEGDIAAPRGTAPPAAEAAPTEAGDAIRPGSASRPAMRIIHIGMRVPPVSSGTPWETEGEPKSGGEERIPR